MAKDKVYIQIDNDQIELKGKELEAFEADRKQMQDELSLIEAEQTAKREARESAIKKLAEIAGLSAEEIKAII